MSFISARGEFGQSGFVSASAIAKPVCHAAHRRRAQIQLLGYLAVRNSPGKHLRGFPTISHIFDLFQCAQIAKKRPRFGEVLEPQHSFKQIIRLFIRPVTLHG